MYTVNDVRNGSEVVIVPSFGNREPIKGVVSGIKSSGVQPIIDYTFEGGKGWAFYSQIEKIIKL